MSVDDKATAGTDGGLDPILKRRKAEAEARKAIAEAELATAAALFPKLPAELPGSEVDASGDDASFATVNCYRAARVAARDVAVAVRKLLPGSDPTVWLAAADGLDTFDVANLVDTALDDAIEAVADATAELAEFMAEVEDGEDEVATTDFVGGAIVATAISAGLPMLFDALSSKITVKTAAATVDRNALLDLVASFLVSGDAPKVTVLRADAPAPLADEYVTKTRSLRTGIRNLRIAARNAGDAVRRIQASDDARVAVAELSTEWAKTVIGRDTTTVFPNDAVSQAQTAISNLDDARVRTAVLAAKVSFAETVADSAAKRLETLTAVEPGGTSLLARAGFAKRLGSTWLRLEVDAVQAGGMSTTIDNRVVHDRAIHLGSVTVSYRLLGQNSQVIASNTLVRTASSVTQLDTGEHEWVATELE